MRFFNSFSTKKLRKKIALAMSLFLLVGTSTSLSNTLISYAQETENDSMDITYIPSLSLNMFATPEQLVDYENFNLYPATINEDDYTKTLPRAKKVFYGYNSQTWYIAGGEALSINDIGDGEYVDDKVEDEDSENNIDSKVQGLVLICDPQKPLSNGNFRSDFSYDSDIDIEEDNDSTYVLQNIGNDDASGEEYENNDTSNDYENEQANQGDFTVIPQSVYPNHYGTSDVRSYLKEISDINSSYVFSSQELDNMLTTPVYTYDVKNTAYYYNNDKLYLPYFDSVLENSEEKYISVGSNPLITQNSNEDNSDEDIPDDSNQEDTNTGESNDGSSDTFTELSQGIKVDYSLFNSNYIWLRSAYEWNRIYANCLSNGMVTYDGVNNPLDVTPAFNLNMSNVLFASAATPATANASLVDYYEEANPFTFRFVDNNDYIDSAIGYTSNKILVSPGKDINTTYIYVQGNYNGVDWVYSEEVGNDSKILSCNDIMNLIKSKQHSGVVVIEDFNDCKIWLESYDDFSNLTYAQYASAIDLSELGVNAVKEKAATCSQSGNIAYWYYTWNNTTYYFSDKNCTKEIIKNSQQDDTFIEINPDNHDYNFVEFEWDETTADCEACIMCTYDNSHISKVPVELTKEVILEPTCNEEGITKYEATYTDADEIIRKETKEYSDIPIDDSKHQYRFDKFKWDNDKAACIACIVCEFNDAHTAEIPLKLTSEKVSTASCTKEGVTVYTATYTDAKYGNYTYSKTYSDGLDPDNHMYKYNGFKWGEDKAQCNVEYICTNCKSTELKECSLERVITVPATCTTVGEALYTASYSDGEDVYTDTRTYQDVEYDSSNHKYKQTGFEWFEDKTCNIIYSCDCNENKIIYYPCKIEASVTTPSTCTTKGQTTYNASYTDGISNFTDSKTFNDVDYDLNNHEYKQTGFEWLEDNSCKIIYTCGCSKESTRKYNCNVTSQITIPSTCTQEGAGIYTATYKEGDVTYTDTKIITNIPVEINNHKYVKSGFKWSKDNKSCEICYVCKYNETHTVNYLCEVMSEIAEKPTCRDMGITKYIACYDHEGMSYMYEKEVRDIPVTDDHIWDNGIITKAPTVDECGEKTFTCEVCDVTDIQQIPKLELSTEEPSTEEPSTEEPSTEEPSAEEPTTEDPSTEEIEDINVYYNSHVQSKGWEFNEYNHNDWKCQGDISGTVGSSKRLEGIRIILDNGNSSDSMELGIRYTTHCQSYGWLPWCSDGELSGTVGEAKRLEAIMIKLTGENAMNYDVYYRVHAQSYGWLNWAKNGEPAGTAGLGKRLESIQVIITKKDENFNDNLGNIKSDNTKPYISNGGKSPVYGYEATDADDPLVIGDTSPNISYRTHVQSYGWQKYVYNGALSGTSGKSKRLEGIELNLTNKPCSGDIIYTTHVQTYGWQSDTDNPLSWKKNGELSGTVGEAKRLEAICINLTGEMSQRYDIYYRVHSQTFGWLNWAKNGELSGTAGYSKRLEGIQVVLVPKGAQAPENYQNICTDDERSFIKK